GQGPPARNRRDPVAGAAPPPDPAAPRPSRASGDRRAAQRNRGRDRDHRSARIELRGDARRRGAEIVNFPAAIRRGLPILAPAAIFALVAFLPGLAQAQSVTLDMGAGTGGTTSRMLQLIALLTVLSLAPGILVMVTSFTRIVVALSLLRSALGGQQTPPNMVMVSLALFLTAFVMAPTFEQAYRDGIAPLMAEQISEEDAFARTTAPFKAFMLSQVREKDLGLFMDLGNAEPIASPAE